MATNTVTRKAGRDASEAANVPVRVDGKLNMVSLLLQMLDMPGSMSKAFNRFHKYSMMNMFLVYLQTGKAEPMGSFNRWKSLKRNVIKGSKALFVNHPKFAPVKDDAGNVVMNAKGKPEMKVVGFQLRPTVFQMWQTDGDELKLPEIPEWNLDQALEVLAIQQVPFTESDGNVGGYSFTDKDGQHKLAINPVNPGHSPMATVFHEIAHVVLGHTKPEFTKAGLYQGDHRGVAEFQAEATAYLLMHELELPFAADESRGYVQGWLKGRESDWMSWDDGNLELVQDKVIRQILKAADDILVAGRKRHFDAIAESEAAEADSRPAKPRRNVKSRKR